MEHTNDTEQQSLSERLKKLESIVLLQGEQIGNLLAVSSGLAEQVKTLTTAAQGHQRIFESLHAAMVERGLISENEPPAVN